MSARARAALQGTVAAGLLAFLVYQIGPSRLWEAFGRARPLYLALAFLVICVDSLLRSVNWRLTLAARDDRVQLATVFQAFAVGGFVGYFVPSSLGSDAGRAVSLTRRSGLPVARTASSLVMLNLTGFWALGVIFLAGLAGLAIRSRAPSPLLTVAGVALVVALAIPALLWTRGDVPAPESDNPLLSRLADFAEALASYRDSRSRLLPVFLVALVNQVFAVLVFYLVFHSTGARLDLLWFPVLVPAITLARLIPVSMAGFGGEQAAVVVAFAWAGAAASRAMAASLLVSLLTGVLMAGFGLYFAGESVRVLLQSRLDATGGSAGAPGSRENGAPGGPEDGAP